MPTRAHPPRSPALALIACQLVISLASCQNEAPEAARAPGAAAPSAPVEHALVVFAAASLRDVFTTLGRQFEHAHPGLAITFDFAGTQELRTQLEHGAAADVFASADTHHTDELVHAGRVAAPVVFARNEPVLIVAEEAAATVRSLADLLAVERIVVGTPEVPIGRYTQQILERAAATLGGDFRTRVEAKVVSRELNVKQVLTKVRLGEAQAGFVYRTDTRDVPEVTVVTIPPELNVIADYPIAVVVGAPHPTLARAFVEHVLSEAGQRALQQAGFSPVPAIAAAPSPATAPAAEP